MFNIFLSFFQGNCQFLSKMYVQNHKKLKADRPYPRNHSTYRQTPWTDNDSSLLFAALGKAEPLLGKAEPLISTATRQKFDLDL